MNKLHLIERSGRLTCNWVKTGDPRLPLVCVWTINPQVVSKASSNDDAGGMHLCA